MHDNCSPNDCPVSARVDALQEEFNRYRGNSSKTHKEMFDRINALEQNKAALTEKLDGINEKLDSISEKVGFLMDKPGKRWDGLVDKLLCVAAGAVVAWLAAGAPMP